MRLRDRVVVGWVGAVGLAAGVGAAVDFAWLAEVARKEGPVEWVSEALLAAAIVGWLVRARSATTRWLGIAVAVGCAVVLAEELDWGRGVQLPYIATRLESLVGQPNLHNAGGGASYLLFALPWLALYFAAAKGWGAAAGIPPRTDATAALAIALVALGSVGLPGDAEAVADELTELALYGLLLLGAWRGQGRRSPTTVGSSELG